MSSKKPRDHPAEDIGAWTNETLPLSLRKELLERELRKLGYRKPGPDGAHASAQQHHQSQHPESHPQAGDGADAHGD